MKNIFLSIALAMAIHTSAQNPIESSRTINRASEWSKQSALEVKKIDSSKLVKKTITQEIALPKALDVLIDMSGELIINTWSENKIKLETTVQFEEPNELTDTQWLDKLGINMKVFGSTIKVKSKIGNGITYFSSSGTVMPQFDLLPVFYNNGTNFNVQKGYRQVTLYIPAESILEIESKYGRLKIRNNIKSLLLNNTDGDIEFANIEKLQIRSNRGSFSGGIVAEADVELSHARFSLKQLNKAVVTSNYSTIEVEALKEVKLISSNDEIDIDNVSVLYGIKNYGNLRINQLTGKLDLQGVNSDIKLRHINPSAQLVKILNRNADLRLSASDLSNFLVDVKGSYNKIYSTFEESTAVDTLTAVEIESVKSMTNVLPTTLTPITINVAGTASAFGNRNNVPVQVSGYSNAEMTLLRNTETALRSIGGGNVLVDSKNLASGRSQNPYLKYSAKVGTGNSQLKYQIICTSCVIDFK